MITAFVLVLLGIALLVVLVAMARAPSGGGRAAVAAAPVRPQVETAPLELDAWDAKKGDVISISGAAEDFSDLDFPVDRRSAYESNQRRWVDLSGEFRGRRVYLEVYRHPQADYIGILDGRKLTLDEIGVSEPKLVELDSRQDAEASIEYEGKTWHFESSREIGYFENEAGAGEGLYRWVLREQGGSRLLCIEKWEGEPFDVRIARRLTKQDITVYRGA